MAALEEIKTRLKEYGIVVSDKDIGDRLKMLRDDFHVPEVNVIGSAIRYFRSQKPCEDQLPAKKRERPPKDNKSDNAGHKSTHDDGSGIQVDNRRVSELSDEVMGAGFDLGYYKAYHDLSVPEYKIEYELQEKNAQAFLDELRAIAPPTHWAREKGNEKIRAGELQTFDGVPITPKSMPPKQNSNRNRVREPMTKNSSEHKPKKSSSGAFKPERLSAIEEAILHLAGCCDGAKSEDGRGFNKDDSPWGHKLADKILSGQHLSDAEADDALEMIRKYSNTQLAPAGIKLPSSENGKQSQAAKLVAAALADGNEIWHTPDDGAYITISRDNHKETYQLRSKKVKDWLSYTIYSDNGQAPGSQALQDALTVLEGKALFEGDLHSVYVRVAPFGNSVYLDLGDETWEAIEISAEGWKFVANPPVRFTRPKNISPIPRPIKGGSWHDLRDLLNANDNKTWIQIVAWLSQAYWPKGPYTHLVLNGEQGSGKSKVTEILKALVDPSTAGVRRPSRQEVDLMVTAQSERILAYDNLSGLSKEMSDAFCCLSTGSTLGRRALYTDSDESLMSAKKPCILNGIDSIASRGDLLDRVLIVNLDSIPEAARRKDCDITAEFERVRPSILGLILDATSMGLKRISCIDMPNLPRMADFAAWVIAAEPALPWGEGEFLEVYKQARNEVMTSLFETDRFAQAVYRLVNSLSKKSIEKTATELLEALNRQEGISQGHEPQGWPKAANKVTSRLRRVAPQLRAAGVNWLELDRTGDSRGIRIWIADNNDDTAKVSSS